MKVGIKQKLRWVSAVLTLSMVYSTQLLLAHEAGASEPDNTGTVFSLDDDLFSSPGRDHDYTGGFSVSFSGARASRAWFSSDPLLALLDRLTRINADSAQPDHALTVGVIAFTPKDIASAAPVLDDRPYASLAFLSSSRRYVFNERNVAYNTHLVIGVMGLSAVGSGHRAIHRLASSDPVRGYANQVSAGGEPTVRYSLARQSLISSFADHGDLKWTVGASLGTVTEGSVALNTRWGRIRSPWWSEAPEQTMYMQDAQPRVKLTAPETFFTAGVRVKARAYNAFLQGQFRDSAVSHSLDELNIVLAEAWAGVVMRRPSGLELRYLARFSSPELRHGPASRSLLWGSLEFARAFGAEGR